MSFHSRQSFSISFFHVSSCLPAPRLPLICIAHAVLTAPLERSTCPNQQSLLSLKMRSRFLSSSFEGSSLDLTVATSSGFFFLCDLYTLFSPSSDIQRVGEGHLSACLTNYSKGIFLVGCISSSPLSCTFHAI